MFVKGKQIKYLLFYKHNSIYVRMLVMSMILIVVLVFIIGNVVTYRSTNIIKDNVQETNMNNLYSIRQTIDFSIEKADKLLLNIARSRQLQKRYIDLSTEERLYLMRGFIQSFFVEDYIESVYVYYQDEQKVLAEGSITNITAMKDLEWLSTYDSVKPLGYKSKITIDSAENPEKESRFIRLMRGFPIDSQRELGVVVVNINQEKLLKQFEVSGKTNSTIFIVDKSENLLIGNSEFYNKLRTSKAYRNNDEKKGYFTAKISGQETAIASIPSETQDWLYMKTFDLEPLNKATRDNVNYIGILIAISLIIGLFVCCIYINRLYCHFLELIEIAEKNGKLHDANGTNEVHNEFNLLKGLIERITEDKEKMGAFYLDCRDSLLQQLLLDLCYGGNPQDNTLIQYLREANFPIDERLFVAVVIHIDSPDTASNLSIKREVISDNTSDDYDLLVTCMQTDNIVCMVSLKNSESQIFKIACEIRDLLKYEFGVESTIGIGNAYTELRQFYISFNEALDALNNKSLFGNEAIIHINNCFGDNNGKYHSPLSKENDLEEAIKRLDKDGALKIVEEISCNILLSTRSSKTISLLLWQLMNSIVHSIGSMGILYQSVTGIDFYEDLAVYNQIDEIENMIEFVKDRVVLVIDYINEERNYHNEIVVQKIKSYVDEHCAEELSLEVFASIFMLSPSYISTIFKKFSNEGLRDYIIRIRMEKAKELLLADKKSIEIISREVGYENVRSFVRAFKSYCGVTPSEYRIKKA